MATSSITKNFVVSEQWQVEMFADAIEESYRETLTSRLEPDLKITRLRGAEAVKNFMDRRNKGNA